MVCFICVSVWVLVSQPWLSGGSECSRPPPSCSCNWCGVLRKTWQRKTAAESQRRLAIARTGDGAVSASQSEFENRVIAPRPGARPMSDPTRNWRAPRWELPATRLKIANGATGTSRSMATATVLRFARRLLNCSRREPLKLSSKPRPRNLPLKKPTADAPIAPVSTYAGPSIKRATTKRRWAFKPRRNASMRVLRRSVELAAVNRHS